MSVKLLLDSQDEWDDLDQEEDVTVATGCEILATAEPGDASPKMKLRLNTPRGGAVVYEQDVATFVQAVRGLAAKYGV